MSQYTDQAIAYINQAAKEFGGYVDQASQNIAPEDFAKVNQLYDYAASLTVAASQLSGEQKVVEDVCEVDNTCAKVTVGGVEIRGNIEFELQLKGEWKSGHRMNSQYGQVFLSKEGVSKIITGGSDRARVTFPLKMCK